MADQQVQHGTQPPVPAEVVHGTQPRTTGVVQVQPNGTPVAAPPVPDPGSGDVGAVEDPAPFDPADDDEPAG